mgnify:CR=1 FL=1
MYDGKTVTHSSQLPQDATAAERSLVALMDGTHTDQLGQLTSDTGSPTQPAQPLCPHRSSTVRTVSSSQKGISVYSRYSISRQFLSLVGLSMVSAITCTPRHYQGRKVAVVDGAMLYRGASD